MSMVKVQNKVVSVDEKQIPLYSGEIHYWRLAPESWRSVLERAREMGLDCIATYVCWDFHEYEPGKFDFRGETDPRRNLIGFLDLLTEEGYWIILRPGPYIYSEWKNSGVPDWAANFHRLHPEFLSLAKRYMRAVTEIAQPYLASNGGRIILWQSDNEIDPWMHWYTEELGLGKTPGIFQEFLEQTYSSITELNQIWATQYANFEEARAFMVMMPEESIKMRRHLDVARFQHWYVDQVARWGVEVYRELGVDVPIYLNTYSGVGTQSWAPLEDFADFVGSDIYPSRNFENRPNEHRNFLDAVRYGHSFSRLPYVAEFQSGIWHDWLGDVGMLTANHYQLICLSALAAGAAGWNWYMLVNRDNWYQSPINEWGRVRPDTFQAFAKMMEIVRNIQPHTLEKHCAAALTYDPLQRATARPAQDLLLAFYDAGVDYQFFDMARGTCSNEVVFYAGGEWLSQAGQQKLMDYVQQGGHLVLLGAYPYLDDHLMPCNQLAIQEPDGMMKGMSSIPLALSNGSFCHSQWFYQYNQVPGDPIKVKRKSPVGLVAEENQLHWNLQTDQEYIVGYTERKGKGKITVVGLEPTPELIIALHQYLSINIPVRSLTPGIQTSLFQRDGSLYIFVLNPTPEDKTVEVILNPDLFSVPAQEVVDLVSGRTVKFDGRLIAMVSSKNGAVIRLDGETV